MSTNVKISALTQGTPAETDVVPYVDLATNTTKKALKSELKGDKGDTGDNATIDVGTTTTGNAGTNASVVNVGTTNDAIFNFTIPRGDTGADGACVESVSFVGNDMVFVLEDASTIVLTNAKVTLKGETGNTGAKIVSGAFVGNDLVFTLDDSSTATVTNAKIDLKGTTGDTGATGSTGTSIRVVGAWDSGTAYVNNATYIDYVTYLGSTYYCKVSNTNNLPTDTTYWGLAAQKGADGIGSGDISGSGVANEIAYFTAEKTIDNLPVATYPSLTEVSYVKGVTSAIQTQLNAKGVGDMTLAGVQSVTGAKTFDKDKILMKGTSTGVLTISNALTNGTSYTQTFPARTGTVANLDNVTYIGTTSVALNRTSANLVLTGITSIDGTSTNLSGTPALPNGTTATTQSANDNSTKLATTAYVDAKASGASVWTALAGATRVSNTSFTVTGNQTALISKGMIIKWTESSTVRCAMVDRPSTFSTTTTVTIVGDTMASIDASSLKYCMFGAENFTQFGKFAYAGIVGATGTDVMNSITVMEPMRVLGADMYAGTAGTTNSTTVNIVNGTGTVTLASPTLGSTVRATATPQTPASSALSVALNDRLQVNVTAVQTTACIDLYVQLYLFPTRLLNLV